MTSIAATFFQLKLALLRGGFRVDSKRKQLAILGWIYGAALALGAVIVLAVAARDGHARTAVVGVYATLFFGWTFFPLLGFANDETLDPSRLALLPLRPVEMAVGLATAALSGVGGACTLVVVLVAMIVASPSITAAPLAIAAGLLELATCVVAGRLLTTALSVALRSRRGRDLGVVVTMFAGLTGIAFNQASRFAAAHPRAGRVLLHLAETTPGGWLGRAPFDATSGKPAQVAGELILSVALLAWALVAWSRAIQRVITTVDQSAPDRKRRRHVLGFTAQTRWSAVAARELRYGWRDPRRRVAWLQSLIMGGFVSISVARPGGGALSSSLVLGAIGVIALFGASALANTFGQDGTALWMQIAVPGGETSDVVGKLVAGATIVLGLCVVAASGLCAATGHLATLPAAIGLAAAVFGCASAITLNVAVAYPIPVPESSNAFTSQSGRGCLYGLITLATLVAGSVLALPVALLAFTHGDDSASAATATLLAGVAWGAIGAVVGVFTAGRQLRNRGADILQDVIRY